MRSVIANGESAPLLVRITLDSLEAVRSRTKSQSIESEQNWVDFVLHARFASLRSLLQSTELTSSLLRTPLTRVLMFLRACEAFLFDSPPASRQLAFVPSLFAASELFWRKVITDSSLLRAESELRNSQDSDEREKLGLYRLPEPTTAEFPLVFANALFSQFYVGFRGGLHDRPRFICCIDTDCAVPRPERISRGSRRFWSDCGRFQ